MQDDSKRNEIEQKDDVENNTSISRRRFTQASMVTPVVLSLASRPVLGQVNQCSTSGLQSGNHSGVEEIHCQGCSTVKWGDKENEDEWKGTYKPLDKFGEIFAIGDQSPYKGKNLKTVLNMNDDVNSNVGKETVAALLNADNIEDFGYTTVQIIAIYNTWGDTGGTNAELSYKFRNLHNDSALYDWISCPF